MDSVLKIDNASRWVVDFSFWRDYFSFNFMSDVIKDYLKPGPDLDFEQRLWDAGLTNICGVDEVGRGSLAGPVMACAVIFKRGFFNPEVEDSKKNIASEKICT